MAIRLFGWERQKSEVRGCGSAVWLLPARCEGTDYASALLRLWLLELSLSCAGVVARRSCGLTRGGRSTAALSQRDASSEAGASSRCLRRCRSGEPVNLLLLREPWRCHRSLLGYLTHEQGGRSSAFHILTAVQVTPVIDLDAYFERIGYAGARSATLTRLPRYICTTLDDSVRESQSISAMAGSPRCVVAPAETRA